jgi:oxygen-independent coproporphyrinogen-3 oxidase
MDTLRYHEHCGTVEAIRPESEPHLRFTNRLRTHVMPSTGRPIVGEALAATFAEILETPATSATQALYVHIPFCQCVCAFCGLARKRPADESEVRDYVDALVSQLRFLGRQRRVQNGRFDAVYVGGGTPTLLTSEQLARVMQTIASSFPLADDAEWTVEGRFMDFDDAKVQSLLACGVNRLSLGVQTFHNTHRRRMGRVFSGDEAAERLTAMKSLGVPCLSIDLITNLPDQTPGDFEGDLQTATALAIDGISVYPLSVQENSSLHEQVQSGWVWLGSLEHEYRLFMLAEGHLRASGYVTSGNTHWVRPNRDRNVYNHLAADPQELLAAGSFAGGAIGPMRYMNFPNVLTYTQRMNAGQYEPMAGFVRRSADSAGAEQMRELVLHGQTDFSGRQGGIDVSLASVLEEWVANDFVRCDGGVAVLTALGRFWANNLSSLLDRRVTDESMPVMVRR